MAEKGLDVDAAKRVVWRRPVLPAAALVGAVAALAVVWGVAGRGGPKPPTPVAFNGASTALQKTVIVPTLDTPIGEGRNAVWCASFEAAWQEMAKRVVGAPITVEGFEGADTVVGRLNAVPPVKGDLPDRSYYVNAGRVGEGIIAAITSDMRRLFPKRTPPSVTSPGPEGLVSYACLEADIAFPRHYFDNDEALQFVAGDGSRTRVRSFGIMDSLQSAGVRAQPRVLYWAPNPRTRTLDCSIDLCRGSTPSQVIVALMERGATLGEMVAKADEWERKEGEGEDLGEYDTLVVPETAWWVTHRFAELEGRALRNPGFEGMPISVARQDIGFRLDSGGANLRSEARQSVATIATRYGFDRPYLIIMRKRDAAQPYFVMWVDNAELLNRW